MSGCKWCEKGFKPSVLDEKGRLVERDGIGYLCHAFWRCIDSPGLVVRPLLLEVAVDVDQSFADFQDHPDVGIVIKVLSIISLHGFDG